LIILNVIKYSKMPLIHYKKEESIAWITLQRPEKFNAFVREMALELQLRLDEAAQDEQVRCVVISGSGKAFCAGQDLAEAIDPEGPQLTRIVEEHYNPIILKIRQMGKPVIAAVNGVAAGAGANIALACDVVMAASSATFIQAFSKIGLIPDSGGTFFLPRLIGLQRAAALMMMGDKIKAEQAMEMGMIYRACADEVLQETAWNTAKQLAAMPTKAIGLTKKALNLSLTNNLLQQLDIEEEFQTLAGKTYDYKEGVNAFLEKRNPIFRGE